MIDFTDLDDLDTAATKRAPAPQTQACMKCSGTGKRAYGFVNIRYYPCTMCKGTGTVTSTRLARIEGAKKAQVTRQKNLDAKRVAWVADHKAEAAWVFDNDGKFEFATAMMQALVDYGELTDGQLAAVQRCMARAAERKATAEAEAAARSVDVQAGASLVRQALERAAAGKIRKPMLRAEGVTLSLAPATGKNPGCVYVKSGAEYVGKITETGVFQPVRSCTDEQRAAVVEMMNDPLAAAVKYGRLTGLCSCCGRKLDNKLSIELGIGPICREKFFG